MVATAPVLAPGRAKLPRKERAALEELLWRGVAAEPLRFLAAARTFDEHAAAGEAIKAFPVCARCAMDPAANVDVAVLGEPPAQISVCRAHGREHKPYFRVLTEEWLRSRRMIVPKSRQLLCSWWAVAIHLWLAMTRPGLIAFQSLNRTKSCELLDRAALIYRTLPKELQRFGPLSDSPKAGARKVEDVLTFQHELVDPVTGAVRRVPSRIMAIPNGPHHVRMYTFSAVFVDEAALWESDEDFEESYVAALATVQGGGRLLCVSSMGAPGSFFTQLCEGRV